MRWTFLIGIFGAILTISRAGDDGSESDGDTSRKILGSSVVTSVSVVMDTGNKKNTIFTDAVGKPQPKPANPSELASPIELLNPDRYEFYTFDDNGDLVKRLMSLEEIKSIIATGDSDALDLDSFTSQGFLPEKRVSDVVNNVQSVLKEEMEILKDPISKPIFDTPDVSDSWSMILPAVFGNSGEDIKPEKPAGYVTPDTIMIEPNFQSTSGPQKVDLILSSTKKPSVTSTTKRPLASISTASSIHISQPVYYSSPLTTKTTPSTSTAPSINVEIFSNSISTPSTEKNQEDEEVPTRITNFSSITNPPLVRNVTRPATTLSTSTGTETSSSTQKISSITQEIQSSSLKPLTKWTSTSSKPGSTQSSTTQWTNTSFATSGAVSSVKPPPNIFGFPPFTHVKSTTPIQLSAAKPTLSTHPNIFGFPVKVEQMNNPTITVSSSTTLPSKTSTIFSSTPSSQPITAKPTRSPHPNIFGFPVKVEQKTDPTTILASSSTSQPTKTSTIFSSSTLPTISSSAATSSVPITSSTINTSASLIKITPELSITSTVGNVQPSSLETKNQTDVTGKPIEKVVISSTSTPLKLTTSETYSPSTWRPSPEDAHIFNIFKEVLAESTSTETARNESKTPSPSTEYFTTDSTTINDAITFESNKILATNLDDDLSTLPTEQKLSTSLEYDNDPATTKLPTLLNALNDKQKVSASELLDQLLFSTNIYEINTELASPKPYIPDTDQRFDNSNSKTTLPVQELDQQSTTTDQDFISYPPTTDITLIQSIEQLLSQAVGDVQTVLNQTTEGENYGKEAETSVTAEQLDIMSTTEGGPSESTETFATNINLGNSVEALLSQVNDAAALNKIILTEKPHVDVTYRKVEEHKSTASVVSTTQTPTVSSISTEDSVDTEQFKSTLAEREEAEQEATTFYYVVKRKSQATSEIPYLINITLLGSEPIRNLSKPAKADLSLEQELLAAELKNLTLIEANKTSEASEVIKESETKIVLVSSTSATTIESTEASIGTFTKPPDSSTIVAEEETTTDIDTLSTTQFESVTGDNHLFSTDKESTTTDIVTTQNFENESTKNAPALTTENVPTRSTTIRSVPKPSIVISINENNTLVSENGKLVANKTIATTSVAPTKAAAKKNSTLSSLKQQQKNSTQDQTWTLVSTVAPQQASQQHIPPPTIPYPEVLETPVQVDLVPKPMQGFGLEDTTSALEVDVHQFANLCNELAFGFWKTVTTGLSSARSLFVSPFAATSILAMVFLGAKGATSEEMNEILKLDDMVTFNPHLIFKSVTESVVAEPNSGIATTAMIRELFSDRSKGKLLDFYKNRVRAFYDGFVEEVSYREIGDIIRRRSNLLVKKYTNGKYTQFFNDASIVPRSPLSGIGINIFETDCSNTSSEGRDGEIHFVVFPSIKQRRLIPIPAVVYRSGFLAGYEPSLDATAVSLGNKEQIISTILVIPGQQGIAAPGDGLARLEKRLVESSFKKGAWSRLLRSLIPRSGLEVQIPRFSHRSVINTTNTLQRMGLHELFSPVSADLRGLNGVANELHLSDVLQINKFATCGEKRQDEVQHSEVYPATTMRARSARRLHHLPTLEQDEPRDYQRAFHDPLHDPSLLELPLPLRPRQARIPEVPRLRFDRPFLYFIRHNPTGLILHMGRFNPRLLP
ncbi:unnamed protein product [Ceutorhynchus assimilis]|uniref:Serpin domain-containing protein n=1 Tax=Ceutorhynchus assimilis TaxID=467358 RepID=A0A9N9MJY6_9CUCU|nr:unnamed protein product [Ceutorhynchus assimilis]